MPRIPKQFTGSVVYLYPDEKSARAGENVGGSGFLAFAWVGIPGRVAPAHRALYAVTNQHVAKSGTVARAVNHRGEERFFATPREGWRDHPDGDDVSIFPLGVHGGEFPPFPAIDSNTFVRLPTQAQPGDDVFFVGRFMRADGKMATSPLARFGHIAADVQKVYQEERGFHQESFIVESLSMSGYSGSPVVLFGIHLATKFGGGVEIRMGRQGDSKTQMFPPELLGIDWGHLSAPKPEPVREKSEIYQDMYVRQNAGLAGVVPAWKITELLQDPEVLERREKERRNHEGESEGSTL